ncbi:predicted protein [Postia placenta Mad-698-R]|nr:predicted protein [Postia placenta Mad-698-R]
MSVISTRLAAALAFCLGQFQEDCVYYACAALLIYYVALNLPHDVQCLWARRSIATLLSAINWLAITGTIITNMPLPQSTTQRYVLADTPTPDVVAVMSRGSVVVSDILVVVATWYYISRTSSVKTQLVRDMWAARPNLTTVMFRHGTLYFLIISLLNIVNLIMIVITAISSFYVLDITGLTTAMSSILISRFLICIREAAERSTHLFGSQSLSFVDSQGSVSPQPWLSSVEFASDIANHSAENGHADAFPDLDDNSDHLDSECGEEEPELLTWTAAGDSIREYCGLNSKRTSILAKCGVREGMSVPNCPVPVNKTMLSISSTAHSRARFVTGRPHRLGLLTETRLRATRTPTETCLEQRRVGTYKNVRASEHISPRNEPTGGGHAHVALTGLSRRPGHVHAEDGGGGGLVGDIHHERSSM